MLPSPCHAAWQQGSTGTSHSGWPEETLQRLCLLFAALEPALDLLVPEGRRGSRNHFCKSLARLSLKEFSLGAHWRHRWV